MPSPFVDFVAHHQTELFDSVELNEVEPLLLAFIDEITPKRPWHHGKFEQFVTGKEIVNLPTAKWRNCLLVALKHLFTFEQQVADYRSQTESRDMWGGSSDGELLWQQRMNWFVAVRCLLKRQLPLNHDEASLLLHWLVFDDKLFGDIWLPLSEIVNWFANQVEKQTDWLSNEQKQLLIEIKTKFEPIKQQKNHRLVFEALEAMIDDRPRIKLQAGEAWSDLAIADLKALEPLSFKLWCQLIDLCKLATVSKPTKKWQQQAESLVSAIGMETIESKVFAWFELVPKPRTQVIYDWQHLIADPNLLIIDEHLDILRGLVWLLALSEHDETPDVLVQLALTSYEKVPGVGQRAVKLGSACIYSLSQLQRGKSGLIDLQQQLEYKGAVKAIEKVLAVR